MEINKKLKDIVNNTEEELVIKDFDFSLFKKIDYDKSKAVYEEYKRIIKPHMCYNNIFNIYLREVSNKYKVGYCYTTFNGLPLLTRHCVLIDKEDSIIDPTIFYSWKDERDEFIRNSEYLIFDILETKKYVESIERFGRNIPDNLGSDKEINYYKNNIFKTYFQIREEDFFTFIIPFIK